MYSRAGCRSGDCHGVSRIESDRLIEILDSAVVLALVVVGVAAVEEGSSEIFRRLLARLDQRRTATNLEVWIVALAPRQILVAALRRR